MEAFPAKHVDGCAFTFPAAIRVEKNTDNLKEFGARRYSCTRHNSIRSNAPSGESGTPASHEPFGLSSSERSDRDFQRIACRVGGWRASFRVRWQCHRFRAGPQSDSHGRVSSPPLPEPGVPISGTGLSSGIMRFAHGPPGRHGGRRGGRIVRLSLRKLHGSRSPDRFGIRRGGEPVYASTPVVRRRAR